MGCSALSENKRSVPAEVRREADVALPCVTELSVVGLMTGGWGIWKELELVRLSSRGDGLRSQIAGGIGGAVIATLSQQTKITEAGANTDLSTLDENAPWEN